ncbi:hypothetical protein pb186bvf_016502 [Paramecium bursaria]
MKKYVIIGLSGILLGFIYSDYKNYKTYAQTISKDQKILNSQNGIMIQNTIDQQDNEEIKNSVFKLCVTGGRQSGRTSTIAYLKENLEARGFSVLLMQSMTEITMLQEKSLMKSEQEHTQMNLAVQYINLYQSMSYFFEFLASQQTKKAVLIFDGGLLDYLVGLGDRKWNKLQEYGSSKSFQQLRDSSYDAVMHLVTFADGQEDLFFQLDHKKKNNPDVKNAAMKQDKEIQKLWVGHPNFAIIDNSEKDFDIKLQRSLSFVAQQLQLDVGFQPTKKRKFLLTTFNLSQPKTAIKMIDTYLVQQRKGEVEKVRRREVDNLNQFLHLTKIHYENGQSQKVQRYLTSHERDQAENVINRTRYQFVIKNQLFSIDEFELESTRNVLILKANSSAQDTLFNLPYWNIQKEIQQSDKNYKARQIIKNDKSKL